MYISGENIVVKPYTPVDAYAVMPMAGGIISGGSGDENVSVGSSARFYWVYDPEPSARNGFTGAGWFCGVTGTPLQSIPSDEELLKQFANGRTDLNDEFAAWQEFVNNCPTGNWVSRFMVMIVLAGGDEGCFSVS